MSDDSSRAPEALGFGSGTVFEGTVRDLCDAVSPVEETDAETHDLNSSKVAVTPGRSQTEEVTLSVLGTQTAILRGGNI